MVIAIICGTEKCRSLLIAFHENLRKYNQLYAISFAHIQ